MSYSPEMSFFLSSLQGFSTNHFKLMPQGSSSCSANGIIRITLPSNSIINWRSFALHFDAAITSANDQGRLPNKIKSLISRVEIQMGGTQINPGNNDYNVLCHVKEALEGDKTCRLLGHPEVVRATSYHTTTNHNGIHNNKEVAAPYVIDDWEGFISTCSPILMDTGLVGDIVISIYLADNAVCIDADGTDLSGGTATIASDAAAPAPVYQLSSIYGTIETVGMADGVFDSAISATMSQQGELQIPFKQYITFQDNTQSAMRFSVATQSLDRIWVAHRDINFNTAGGAVPIKGYLLNDTSGNFTLGDLGGVFDYNKEKYTSRYFNFPEVPQTTAGTAKYQFMLNGALYPQFQAQLEDMVEITKNSLEKRSEIPHGLLTYRNNYHCYCIRLNMPNSELRSVMSGLNTKGVSLNAFYNMYNVNASRPIWIACECTSILHIAPGLQTNVSI